MTNISNNQPIIPGVSPSSNINRRIFASKTLSMFYKMKSFFVRQINPLKAKNYQLIADYYQYRAKNAKESKEIFREHLIHCGLNSENPKTLSKSPPSEKLMKIARRVKGSAPALFKVEETSLKFSQNLCAAATAHSAQKYYSYLDKGYSEVEAFTLATQNYQDGAPEKDALVQAALRKRSIDSSILKIKSAKDKNKTLEGLASSENLAKLKADDKHAAKFFKLGIGKHQVVWKRRFLENFERAKPGPYLVSFIDRENFLRGHVFLVIKNSDQSVSIFDLNFGAGFLPKDESKAGLKRLIDHPSYKQYNRLAYVPLMRSKNV